jgi:hypothetical protein
MSCSSDLTPVIKNQAAYKSPQQAPPPSTPMHQQIQTVSAQHYNSSSIPALSTPVLKLTSNIIQPVLYNQHRYQSPTAARNLKIKMQYPLKFVLYHCMLMIAINIAQIGINVTLNIYF